MPKTPDRYPGEAEEEGLVFEEASEDPVQVGGIRLVGGAFRMKDESGVFNPRTGGSGLDINSVIWDLAGGIVYALDGTAVVR